MPLTTMQAARKICEHGSWKITNLGLQKISYIAQMLFMGDHNGSRLLDADFEAWDYGPVVPDLYRRVRMFGANPIQDIFFNEPRPNDGLREAYLHNVCTHLAGKRPAELVAITHWKDGAWAKNYQPGTLGVSIPDRDILNEYKRRSESGNS
ncbi:Panacea domain-containing protein [Rhodopseudomonas sp. RCAM05734]|uniref:Panacea domain-containing protein n=1 Tax=Rhodopseudomonas sp. RCAM05734 TaxID=3457549 RepID=UPI0040441975